MKPPHTRKKKHGKTRERKDKNPKLMCRACGKRGLRYGSKTHICAPCIRAMPYIVKKCGGTQLPRIIQDYAEDMVQLYGLELAAGLLDVDVRSLDAICRGQADPATLVTAGIAMSREPDVPEKAESADSEPSFPPEVIAHAIEHYKQIRPVDPVIARLVASWRKPMHVEVAHEMPGLRRQRLNRAERRADLVRYVPRPDAPLDPSAPRNAFGRVDAVGRKRESMPMRVCLGLWGFGFGAPAIARISQRAQWPTSTSSAARMIRQARQSFPGAQAVTLGDLVLEVCKRPVPRIIIDHPDDE